MINTEYYRIKFHYQTPGGYTSEFNFDKYKLEESYEGNSFMCFMHIPEQFCGSNETLENFICGLFDGEGAVFDIDLTYIRKDTIDPKWYNHKPKS